MDIKNITDYRPNDKTHTKYQFFTGKGGVGKTSVACATAVELADKGNRVLLISTDPASNLQDVFSTDLDNKGTVIEAIPNLTVLNLNPEEAAREYREAMLEPYRGKMSEALLTNMEEQLSGSCTVEIAAFNEFSEIITSEEKSSSYDYIIFDTAPTGHTLRMLQLPSAWNNYFDETKQSNSYVGQLSGMGENKVMYKKAVETLSNKDLTTLVLVTRPDRTPLLEVARSSEELHLIGIDNQMLIVNGVLEEIDDAFSLQLYNKQHQAIEQLPEHLSKLPTYKIPLRSYNMTGIENLRMLFNGDSFKQVKDQIAIPEHKQLNELVQYLYATNKRIIFTMGKGGVGKTTMAAAIATGLAEKGTKVHLTTTDPAAHLQYIIKKSKNLSISKIDPVFELAHYKADVIAKAQAGGMDQNQLDYVEEDLRSPCTQEIAVFRAFAEIVNKADTEVVVIDTAPTGHTLLLLDATQSYHREVERTHGDIPESVRSLLPRLKDGNETEVIIVTLPEATPVFEAERLKKDLNRAGIHNNWWIINNSMLATQTNSALLKSKAVNEMQWIKKVGDISNNHLVLVRWYNNVLEGQAIHDLL